MIFRKYFPILLLILGCVFSNEPVHASERVDTDPILSAKVTTEHYQTKGLVNITVDLTPEEKAFIQKHPVIRARVGNNPPLHFYDGKYRGISVDYMNLIAKHAGFSVQYITDIPWSESSG